MCTVLIADPGEDIRWQSGASGAADSVTKILALFLDCVGFWVIARETLTWRTRPDGPLLRGVIRSPPFAPALGDLDPIVCRRAISATSEPKLAFPVMKFGEPLHDAEAMKSRNR